jgi:hypothetical protein
VANHFRTAPMRDGIRYDSKGQPIRPSKHRHVWQATLYDGQWVEYCASLCGVAARKARLRPTGAPVAPARYAKVEKAPK